MKAARLIAGDNLHLEYLGIELRELLRIHGMTARCLIFGTFSLRGFHG